MRIEDLDKNMKISSSLELENIVWFDVRKAPFKIYGLYNPQDGKPFKRMPEELASAANDGVANLNFNTAGGRIRFATDSDVIAIKADMEGLPLMSHIARSGQSGFDIYSAKGDEPFCFVDGLRPVSFFEYGFETYGHGSKDGEMTEFEINMPPYNSVDNVYIGLRGNANLSEGREYKNKKPVVFLGSSITQGGCVSRPGNCFVPMISRNLDIDIVNLGFSGSCHAEESLMEYVTSFDMSLFVYDYDHNASGPEQLTETHLKGYKYFRERKPNVPIILTSKPDWINDATAFARREVILATYDYAIKNGDKNICFIDGEHLWDGPNKNDCTVDSCHPNDLGHFRMAQVYGEEIKKMLKL